MADVKSPEEGDIPIVDKHPVPENEFIGAEYANKAHGGTKAGIGVLQAGEMGEEGAKVIDAYVDIARKEEEINKVSDERLTLLQERTQLKEEMKPLRKQAEIDERTQLKRPEELKKYLNDRLKPGQDATLLFFDIDHFRQVNTDFGHLVGNEVLSVMGQRLNHMFPESAGNFVVRYGGEEFVVIMEGVRSNEIGLRRAEQFRKNMEENPIVVTNPSTSEVLTIPKTVSGGVAMRREGESDDDWIHNADQAMYLAKQTGRNRIYNDDALRTTREELEALALEKAKTNV